MARTARRCGGTMLGMLLAAAAVLLAGCTDSGGTATVDAQARDNRAGAAQPGNAQTGDGTETTQPPAAEPTEEEPTDEPTEQEPATSDPAPPPATTRTAEPAPDPAPAGPPAPAVFNRSTNGTYRCTGGNVSINGPGSTLHLTGRCGLVTVNGASSHVEIDAASRIVVNGVNAQVIYHNRAVVLVNGLGATARRA